MRILYKYLDYLTKGYNYDKYWNSRQKYYKTKNRLRKFFLSRYLRKTEMKNACYIGLPEKKDIFCDRPIMLHGLKGIFISKYSKIGQNVIIMQNVTIGSGNCGKSPIIGNHVFIGAGATVIGNVVIGDYVRIGANATVTKNIPSHSTVVNQESRILLDKNYEDYNLLR